MIEIGTMIALLLMQVSDETTTTDTGMSACSEGMEGIARPVFLEDLV